MSKTFIFGYGNLINPRELNNTLPGKEALGWTTLYGWRVTFSKPGLTHVYATLTQDPGARMDGVLIEVTPEDVAALAQREQGYRLVDVTDDMGDGVPAEDAKVYAFIAPTVHELPIRGSYLESILSGLPDDAARRRWLEMADLEGRKIDRDRPSLPYVEALLNS